MFTEHETLDDPNDSLLVVRVLLIKTLENPSLNESLLVQAFLIPEYFNGYDVISLVIKTLEDLAERPLSDNLLDFVPVGNMVFRCSQVLAVFGVKAVIVSVFLRFLHLLFVFLLVSTLFIHVVDRCVFTDL